MKHQENLVWIDLEMTGLNYEVDLILEIALIITDKDLNILHEGPEFVIHQSDEILESMNEWCKKQHAATGLTQLVQQSKTTEQDAAHAVLATIQEYCFPQTSSLCGNSIWQDRIFLQKYMPQITDYLHYRMIDVTTIKRLAYMWCPKKLRPEFKKKDEHRALSDIKESIEELRLYRKEFFMQK